MKKKVREICTEIWGWDVRTIHRWTWRRDSYLVHIMLLLKVTHQWKQPASLEKPRIGTAKKLYVYSKCVERKT